MTELALEMRGIVKRFPGVLANDQVDFALQKGEVHALLGENGAGKSTLMSILAGLVRPDSGLIRLGNQAFPYLSPKEALSQGIGMVHQHFMLVRAQTVAENLILGMPQVPFFLRLSKIEKQIEALGKRYGLEVDPKAHIWQLSVGEQQRVEILKALYRGARILILDEPTAVLSPQEAESLFETLRGMAKEGQSVIIISHKLQEVLRVADRCTVLRKGKTVAEGLLAKECTPKELAKHMVGHSLGLELRKKVSPPGPIVLEAKSLSAQSDKGLMALFEVSLSIHRGEILGLAGVAGNGQKELCEVLSGLRPLAGGAVRIEGRPMRRQSAKEYLDQGVALIPEDRLRMGSVPHLGVDENLILKSYRKAPNAKGLFLRPKAIREQAQKLIKEFQISVPGPQTPVRTLSGGNLQRVILARELSSRPKLLIAMQPTRGLDVGATHAVHQMLLEQQKTGAAVLLVSEDLDELLALSDRVIVLFGGKVVGDFASEEEQREAIGRLMTGAQSKESSP